MDKTISSSSYDVIVIRQPNNSYKSTPFQVAFSSNLLKNLTKKNDVELYVNEQKIDIPLRLDISNGRITFIKKYEKRNIFSDCSDVSDDDMSQRSKSRDKFANKTKSISGKKDRPDEYKNQKAPKPFWEFAWLFKAQEQTGQKKDGLSSTTNSEPEVVEEEEQSTLQKICEQDYEGEENSKQPMFHLSLCKSLLRKKEKKEQVLKQFFNKRVPYQEFIKDPPKYIHDSELIVKIDDSLYTWELAIAILTCRLAYGKQLSPPLIDDMIRNKFTKSKFVSYFTGQNLTKINISDLAEKKEFSVNNSKSKDFPTRVVIRYRKNPDNETIEKMNLKQGLNKAKFILNMGATKEEVNLKVFLWDYTEKIVISDIDGTITRSDIAGQLLTNYIHVGVVKLFTQIYKRNYKIVYLTARAIGQYNQTTRFLESAQQDGINLPEGPLLMSPDGFIRSFQREVIDKTPDFLKTKMLATVNEMFPQSRKPLYCGFGNRQTDSVAYLRINMDPQKIFCITPKSIITKQSCLEFTTSYVQILQEVDDYFPIYEKQYDEEPEDKRRQSRNSVDLDDQAFDMMMSGDKNSESSDRVNRYKDDSILLKSQQFERRNNEDQTLESNNQTELAKRGSKSVVNNDQTMDEKIKDLEKMFKESKVNISQFETTEHTDSKSQPKLEKGLSEKEDFEAPDKNKVLEKDGKKVRQSSVEKKQRQKSLQNDQDVSPKKGQAQKKQSTNSFKKKKNQ